MALVEVGYQTITYDRRGFGRSGQPWNGYDYDSLTEDLADVMESCRAKDATLVGFSMGGGEVARYVSNYASLNVRSIALVSSIVPYILQTEDNPEGVPAETFVEMYNALRNDLAAFFASFSKDFFGVGIVSKPVSPELLEWTRSIGMPNKTVPNLELIDKRMKRPEEDRSLARITLLSKLMDSAVEIPGLKTRIGLDAVLGLIPGVGDMASSFVSFYVLQVANRRGASRLTLLHMTFNILCDWIIGSVPLAGDVFDIFWKSNQRNVKLLLQDEGAAVGVHRSKTGDKVFIAGLIVTLLAVLAGSLFVTLFLFSRLTRWFLTA